MSDEIRTVTPEGTNPFMWICKYEDGSIVNEFDDKDTEHSLTSIEKDKVSELYLIGRNFKAVFNTKDGKFKFNDDKEVSYDIIPENGEKHNINALGDYHDIIQYKGFYTDGLSNLDGKHTLKCHTCSYHIGWKKQIKFEKEDITIFFKNVLSIIMGKGVKLEIRISSDKDFTGNFFFNLNGTGKTYVKSHNVYEKKIEVKKNKACEFNIALS
jgi:hypothetical protein